jgi:hypothetical protein
VGYAVTFTKIFVAFVGILFILGYTSLPIGSVDAAVPSARTEKVVYLVPDLPTFLYYISTWDGDKRFPVFMIRNRYFEKFVLAYKPDKILKTSSANLGRINESLLRGAVCASWSKETIVDLPRGVSREKFKELLGRRKAGPRGIVLTSVDAKQLPAALALAAAHRQLLDFLSLPSSVRKMKLSETLTFEQKEQIREEVIQTIDRWGYSFSKLDDEVDYITLGLDLPFGFMGTDPMTRTKQRLCLDDGINRMTPDGTIPSSGGETVKGEDARGNCFAYVGRLIEPDEGMSLYQAMCSIFLDTSQALYFDRWPEKWGLRCQEGAWVMQSRIPVTLVKTGQSSMARWRRLVGDLNPFGFLHVSSAGASTEWGDGKVSDIPESVPVIVFFAHSFSASDPYDDTTIAGRWLRNGSFIYFGSISEPYAQSFNTSRTAAAAAVDGEPLAKAFQAKELLPARFTFQWKQIYIGDPLHRIKFRPPESESETSRAFRQAIRMIRDRDIGPAIDALEAVLESAPSDTERQQIWDVLNKTFRLRFFSLRTRRTPVESHFDPFFIDCWYNDTYHPNGDPTTAVVFDKRLNLFQTELLRLYQGLHRTIQEKPRLQQFLSTEMERMKKDATFAKVFLCAGPFSDADGADPKNPFLPDKILRLGSTWQATAGNIRWKVAMVNTDDNYLDLAELYPENDSVIYVAYFPILAKDKPTPVRLHLSAAGASKVWLNNQLVGSVSADSSPAKQAEPVNFELQPGENLLFLQMSKKGSGCRLSARLTDQTGAYLEEVSYADAVAKLSAAGGTIDPDRWRPGK